VTAAASIVVFVGRLRGRLVRSCALCATVTGPRTGKPGARSATVRELYGDISTTGMGMTQDEHATILACRNRTRREYRGYAHEATLNMVSTIGRPLGLTRSQTIEGILLLVLRARGCDLSYVSDDTALILRELDRGVTHNG